ncbi:MAG TPA: GAF domain-containing protein [Candidatus Solibacter sp.]|nr:GAF domain-containing protein [Candidatus Solibacter sp.]
MPRSIQIQAIIEETVAEVFEATLPRLRQEIVRRAVEEVELALIPAPGSSPTELLNAAVASIQDSTSQAEILRHLLEGTARFSSRAALFVVKGSSVNGWQGTGFQDNDAIKQLSITTANGLAAKAIQGKSPVQGPAQEFDSVFEAGPNAPADGTCVVLPLVVKEKVAAVIYADAGTIADNPIDMAALNILCRVAALWLEITAFRKAGAGAGAAAVHEEALPAPSPVVAPPEPAVVAATMLTAAPVEDEVHKKAKRFAKLLVDEIKLYNQPKVAEGKQNRDLYERLKEDIDKSRATYQKRYGESSAAGTDYFTQELIRVLADNDISLMGGSFPR